MPSQKVACFGRIEIIKSEGCAYPLYALDALADGQLDPGEAAMVLRVAGTEGQALYFDALGGQTGANWTLFNEGDSSVGTASISRDFRVVLAQGGEHVLFLEGRNGLVPVAYSFRVVTPNDGAPLSINRAPVLSPIGNEYARTERLLRFFLTATDLDGDALRFTLDPGAPPEALIDAASGQFSWTSAVEGFSRWAPVTARVADQRAPALDRAETFFVLVVDKPLLEAPQVTQGQVRIPLRTAPGERYRVEYKSTVEDAEWLPLGGEHAADDFFLKVTDDTVGDESQRYYRAILLEKP